MMSFEFNQISIPVLTLFWLRVFFMFLTCFSLSLSTHFVFVDTAENG